MWRMLQDQFANIVTLVIIGAIAFTLLGGVICGIIFYVA